MSFMSDAGRAVERYFHEHAEDFDSIYDDTKKSPLRRVRDNLSRGTVVQRLEFVKARAWEWKPATALDVGCGAGRFALALAEGGSNVLGIDVAEDMVKLAVEYAEQRGVADRCAFEQRDLLTWDPPQRYDLTLGIGLLDYIPDADRMMARLASATKGHLVVSFPKLVHPLVPVRYVRLRREGCPVWFYKRTDIERLARAHTSSFEVVPFHRDYLLVAEVS
jgi:SAM-dependent methyltransferase